MDFYLRRVFIYLCWIAIVVNIASCLTCGQTKCSEAEYCCSKETEQKSDPKDCCCSIVSMHCFHSSSASAVSTGFPLYGIVLAIAAVVACYRVFVV